MKTPFGIKAALFSCSRLTLLALPVVFLLASCSLASSSTPRSHSRPVVTSIQISIPLESNLETLTSANSTVACSDHDRTVVVSRDIQGATITIRLTGLSKEQHLAVPPPVGYYNDKITVTASSAAPSQSLTYIAGATNGTYGGTGNLDVGKHGNSGTLNIDVTAPNGQSPSIQISGNSATFGADGMYLAGSWNCL